MDDDGLDVMDDDGLDVIGGVESTRSPTSGDIAEIGRTLPRINADQKNRVRMNLGHWVGG
jgi:hypothetical protein